jgi:hypothetical protein
MNAEARGWGLYRHTPDGIRPGFLIEKCFYTRREAVDWLMREWGPEMSWRELQRMGFRAVRVTLSAEVPEP